MEEVVYKPSNSDILLGVLVSIVSSLIFLPISGMISLLVKNLAETSQGTATGILILQSSLVSILVFRVLWNNSVYVREVEQQNRNRKKNIKKTVKEKEDENTNIDSNSDK